MNKQLAPLANSATTEDERNKALIVSRQLNKIILESLDFEDVVQKIADAIPNELAFATGVVAIIDEKKGVIRRVAASRTKEAFEAIKALAVPFKAIEISLNDQDNYMAKAVRKHKILITADSYDVLGPILTKEQSKKIQDIMGTKTTFVCPIYGSKDQPIGVFIASTSKTYDKLTQYEKDMIQIFTDGVGIAIEHALLYSRLKDASEQLATANQRLKEIDRLKDDFVSIASHELRTPMTAIRSYVWMALNKPDVQLSDKMKKYLSRTLLSTERLINLVNDMLNVSRIEAGLIEIFPKPLDILALANDVFEEVRPKAGEKSLKLNIAMGKIPALFADENKVHQVLLNLVGNAIKFTPERGQIKVSVKTVDQMAEVSVSDTGGGIAKADLERLFKKFSRLDSSYVSIGTSGGTGLGLYISKSLVELMGGKIWAESQGLGKGSTFTFSLPLATEKLIREAEKYHIKPQTVKELAAAAV